MLKSRRMTSIKLCGIIVIMKTSVKKLMSVLLFAFLVSAVYAKPAATITYMYVAVDTVAVKAKASVTSQKVGELVYGDSVQVLNEKGSWMEVMSSSDESIKGWVNSGSLTKKKIVVNSKKVSTDASELALAGKGFNSTIEAEFSQEQDLSFTAVDDIESETPTLEEIIEFIKEGRLMLDGEIQ